MMGLGRNLSRKRRGKYLERSERPKVERVEVVESDIPMGDDSRATDEI